MVKFKIKYFHVSSSQLLPSCLNCPLQLYIVTPALFKMEIRNALNPSPKGASVAVQVFLWLRSAVRKEAVWVSLGADSTPSPEDERAALLVLNLL